MAIEGAGRQVTGAEIFVGQQVVIILQHGHGFAEYKGMRVMQAGDVGLLVGDDAGRMLFAPWRIVQTVSWTPAANKDGADPDPSCPGEV